VTFPYIKLRPHADGGYRPRFDPGSQRTLGFTAHDLKHEDGRWYNLDETAAYAAKMLAAIKTARGEVASAPAKAMPKKARHSVGDLLDAFLASDEFRDGHLRDKTQEQYIRLAKHILFCKPSRDDLRNKVAPVREPFSLAPARAVTPAHVHDFYLHLCRVRGKAMARSLIALVSSAYRWSRRTPGWELANPCADLGIGQGKPRVAIWSVEALKAMLAAADAMGKPSLGDALLLAVFSGQRQGDLLNLVDQVGATSIAQKASDGEPLRFLQAKTGARVMVFPAPDLVKRLKAAEKRRAALCKVVPLGGFLPVIVDEHDGEAWTGQNFRHAFVKVRRAAATPACREVADLHFHDLRDTAVTWLARAGCTIPEICSYTGHSLQSATTILKHYLELGEPIAREAARKQFAWLKREGVRL
jgi:integrase